VISSELDRLGAAGALLRKTLASGRLSPSYLFEGADGATLREAVLAFATEILAGARPDADAERIAARVREGNHPDLHRIGKDKPTVISVRALGGALDRAHQKPFEGDRQVFVVDPAEAMEREGIARYLKALEEPPEGTVFLLVSTRPDRLPDTVLSRCRRIRFPPLARTELEARLRELEANEDDVVDLARWSGGSLDRPRRMAGADLPTVARDLVAAARDEAPHAADAAERALSSLTKAAVPLAEEAALEKGDLKREALRMLLSDLLYVFSVEARDRAADRPVPLLPYLAADDAPDLLARLGALAAAVPLNVTPAVLVLEVVSALRTTQPPRPS
jgi:DNA polymerase-3 subunit delta'